MTLHLIFHGRFPSEKAASLFVAKSAEAFVQSGLDILLIVPRRRGVSDTDAYEYYGVNKNFKIVYLNTIDLFSIIPDKIAFWISLIAFSISSFIYSIFFTKDNDIIYSNEIVTLILISYIRLKCFYEMHDFPESKLSLFKYSLNRMKWILVHNKWKLEKVMKTFPEINKNKFIYETNAVDIKAFDLNIGTVEARDKLGLPSDKKIIVYTGHLYGWKGVHTLAESAQSLGDEYLVVFVGGTVKDIENFKIKYSSIKNILIAGHKKHNEIPLWQKAADIVVLPNTAKEAISTYYTSPMKLYEYMASKRLIIASDIPSIREIVDDSSAVLFRADDTNDLVSKIVYSCKISTDEYDLYTSNAFNMVTEHTWKKRSERIINFINSNT